MGIICKLEDDLIPPDRWRSLYDKMPEKCRESVEEAERGGSGPIGIGRNDRLGWFIMCSGQGPALVWSERTYELTDGGKEIHCFLCDWTSRNPSVIEHRFCAGCGTHHEDANLGERGASSPGRDPHEWRLHAFPDIFHAVRVRLGYNDHFVEFLVFPLFSAEPVLFQHQVSGPEEDIEKALWEFKGDVKWDGCMDFMSNPECMAHACGTESMRHISEALLGVFALAKEIMPRAAFE